MAKTSEDIQLSRQLDGLSALSDGWDSYSAPAPVADAISRARDMAEVLGQKGYAIAHIGPSVLGGVGLTVEQRETEYAIEFRNSGQAVVTVIDADDAFTVCELKDPQTAQSDILSILRGDYS